MVAWGLAPGKILRATPSKYRVNVAIIRNLRSQKENWSINLNMKDEQATLTLLLLYACIPTIETKFNDRASKES